MLKQEWQRLINRFVWSWEGLIATWKTEPSFKFWCFINVISAGMAFYVDMTAGARALLLAWGLLILAAELINTAVENAVDLAMPDQDPIAKLAKDAGSAAVAMTALAGGLAWVAVLIG
jgi:diacylglycerol kinase (ATP)